MNTLLIVEDEKLIRQGIKIMIQRSGVPVQNIIECNNGQTALEILQSQPVDVMFTDIRMPKMNGIELVEAMQKLEHRPLTVAVSGYDDFSYAVQMMRMGVREYVLKPIDRQQITDILKKLEEEIQRNQQNDKNIKEIGCQQLKFIMLSDRITEKELHTAALQFEEKLLGRRYIVCCLEKQEEAIEEEDIICLNDMEGGCVYILQETDKDIFLKSELRDAYAGVSRSHLGTAELKKAYQEARIARKAAFCRMKHLVEFDDILLEEKGYLPEEQVNQIVQMIGTDKISEALRLVELFVRDMKRGRYSASVLEQNIRILVSEILHTYQNILSEEKQELDRFGNPYEFAQIDELMEELTGWMIAFHEKIGTQFEDYRNKSRMQQAVAYIQENYNKDLNMAVVSNYVSMNYSLFSYAFKQYAGKNFVNYLKELRINEAKRLLAETDMRVIEISQRVGYENEKHFMKIFKSQCGVSPTEYRKNMQFK